MPLKDTVTKTKATELLRSHWRPDAIALKLRIPVRTVYEWERKLLMYNDSLDRPEHLRLRTGRRRRIHTAAKEGLL
jgi:hypothetical protein